MLHKQGLYPKGIRRKYKRQPSPNLTHPNLIEQKFHAKQPNQIWFGDITYIPTHEGMLYCSVFIDCFTRKCVGYSIRNHMRDTLVLDSLEAPIEKEQPTRGLIIHTDQGSQYTGYRFYESSVTHHFIHSHSRKGNPYDNALMESFYKSFKREVLPNKQYKTKAQATVDIVDYLENYYNSKRMHSSLGYLTPMNSSIPTNPLKFSVYFSLDTPFTLSLKVSQVPYYIQCFIGTHHDIRVQAPNFLLSYSL